MAAELEKYNSHTMSHFYTYVALAESTKSNYELLEHDVNRDRKKLPFPTVF